MHEYVRDYVNVARDCRLLGNNTEAVRNANVAIKTELPGSSRWLSAVEDLSICAYYCGLHDVGMQACEVLVAHNAPGVDFGCVARNSSWYLRPLEVLERKTYEVEGLHASWNACNPSVFRASDGKVRTVVRLVDYRQERGRAYVSNASNGVITTSNRLFYQGGDNDFYAIAPEWWDRDSRIMGLEDIKVLTLANGRCFYTANCGCVRHAKGSIRVVGGFIDPNTNPAIDSCNVLDYERSNLACEKNWIPFELFPCCVGLVYSWGPLTILRPYTSTGECKLYTRIETCIASSGWRGSTPAIRRNGVYGTIWIAVVHEVARFEDRNIYMHRFVEFDTDRLLRYSQPFCFEHRGIEYAAGLCWADDQHTKLLVSYGVEDREAKVATVDFDVVNEMLRTPRDAI